LIWVRKSAAVSPKLTAALVFANKNEVLTFSYRFPTIGGMKKATFPITIREGGVSATIRRFITTKTLQEGKDRKYESFRVDYVLLGERKQVWRASLDEAKQAASDACKRIANGDQLALELRSGDRMTYLRATEALTGRNVPLDMACRDYAEAITILSGKTSVIEAARFYMAQHKVDLPRVDVSQAVEEMIEL
jgi:hypothetical protein